MAIFMLGMAVQAQSTISWDFDTLGDTEGWGPVPDGHNSLTAGIWVTNGFDSVVLTASDVTGIDPGIFIATNLSVASGEFWGSIEVRLRTLNANGGTPVAYNPDGTLMVLNGIVNGPVGGTLNGWTNTVEAGEWLVTSLDISGFGTNDITYLRLDVPSGGVAGNFEYDYIKLHTTTNAPPPPVYKSEWEFNTPADLEGWVSGTITDAMIATAAGGSESVLTAGTPGIPDPFVQNSIEPANLLPGLYWSNVVLRVRLTRAAFRLHGAVTMRNFT